MNVLQRSFKWSNISPAKKNRNEVGVFFKCTPAYFTKNTLAYFTRPRKIRQRILHGRKIRSRTDHSCELNHSFWQRTIRTMADYQVSALPPSFDPLFKVYMHADTIGNRYIRPERFRKKTYPGAFPHRLLPHTLYRTRIYYIGPACTICLGPVIIMFVPEYVLYTCVNHLGPE